MFDIGWAELLVIAVVALIVIGPKDLPLALRTLGQWVGKIRLLAREFQTHVDDMVREAELDEVRKQAIALRDTMDVRKQVENTIDPTGAIRDAFSPPSLQPQQPGTAPAGTAPGGNGPATIGTTTIDTATGETATGETAATATDKAADGTGAASFSAPQPAPAPPVTTMDPAPSRDGGPHQVAPDPGGQTQADRQTRTELAGAVADTRM